MDNKRELSSEFAGEGLDKLIEGPKEKRGPVRRRRLSLRDFRSR